MRTVRLSRTAIIVIVRWLLVFSAIFLLAAPSPVWADGAFPNSMGIFAPADKPKELVLATNFGLLISDDYGGDGGTTWRLTCELAVGPPNVTFYQMGAPPADVTYAVTPCGLSISSDFYCSASSAMPARSSPPLCGANGSSTNWTVYDVFADPSDPNHVLDTAQSQTDGGPWTMQVFDSHDQGKTFTPIYTAPSNTFIKGIEVAATDSARIYITIYTPSDDSSPPAPSILLSTNGGTSLQTYALSSVIGNYRVSLARVDPEDPTRVYLRVLDTNGDTSCQGQPCGDQLVIGLFPLGGQPTFTSVLALGASTTGDAIPMAMFYRRTDGALIVSDIFGQVYIAPHGATQTPSPGEFARWSWPPGQDAGPTLTGAPHLQALAERGGELFAVGNDVLDGWALAVSTNWATAPTNDAVTWTPLVRLNVNARTSCQYVYDTCAGVQIVDAGSTTDSGSPSTDGGTPIDAGPVASGCPCGSTGGTSDATLLLFVTALVAQLRLGARGSTRHGRSC
jgi:hypothetical protein